MSKETGGPAYPVDCIVERDEKGRLHGFEISSAGMTLRDYFAAKAMQAWLSQINPEEMEDMMERWAENSYEFADYMLKIRKNKE